MEDNVEQVYVVLLDKDIEGVFSSEDRAKNYILTKLKLYPLIQINRYEISVFVVDNC